MDSFSNKIAVVTGGGTGMGRELVLQLAAEGCSVATCDLFPEAMVETAQRASQQAPPGTRVTTHACDVSDEAQVLRFRDEVVDQHQTDHINLLFNNAGISGGMSFVNDPRDVWERTFNVCWGGVYLCSRAFVPLLVASDDGYLVNTSSVNGIWACLGPGNPATAYSTAKFAVKGFSESLIEDFRVNAPHVKVAVVIPGYVGTDIVFNTFRAHGGPDVEVPEEFEAIAATFRDHSAAVTPADAAATILEGVRTGQWRILVGEDAKGMDAAMRADPEAIYAAPVEAPEG